MHSFGVSCCIKVQVQLLWICQLIIVAAGVLCRSVDPQTNAPKRISCPYGCCAAESGGDECCAYDATADEEAIDSDSFVTIVFICLGVFLVVMAIVFGVVFYKCYKSRRRREMLGGNRFGTPGFSVTYGPNQSEITHLPAQYPGCPVNPNAPYYQDGRVQVPTYPASQPLMTYPVVQGPG